MDNVNPLATQDVLKIVPLHPGLQIHKQVVQAEALLDCRFVLILSSSSVTVAAKVSCQRSIPVYTSLALSVMRYGNATQGGTGKDAACPWQPRFVLHCHIGMVL